MKALPVLLNLTANYCFQMSLVQKFLSIILFFPFCALGQTFTSSNLPLVVLNTNGLAIVDNPKIPATMGIICNGPGKRNKLTDPKNDFNGNISIEIRGSSSQGFPKKSYGFETKSIEMVDMDVSLLGLPEESDWILYAPYTDKTMIRDVFTYTMDASLGHYSPRCRYVELFLNGRYDGVYVLMEKIKRNKNRVDIAKLLTTDTAGENLTGGYIIKIDKSTGGGGGQGWYSDYINNTNKTFYQFDYPKSDEITIEQKSYIQSYVRNMEKALYTQKFTGTGNYHEFLNDTSFIDFMIVNEFAKNVDGYRLSSYLYKGKNKLMNCGPIWDFNLTYGNADYYNGWVTTDFQYQANLGYDEWQNPFWWNKLMLDPNFVQKLKRRWGWIRKNEFSNERINFVTDSLTSLLSEAQVRNYQRWPIIGIDIWPNYYVGPTYASEIIWMKNWMTERLDYLDTMWPYDFTGNENLMASQTHSVYPNPFTDQINIQLAPSINGSGTVELFNTSGLLIRQSNIEIQNGQIQLEFGGSKSLNPGMYVLRISQNNRLLLTEKIIKRP